MYDMHVRLNVGMSAGQLHNSFGKFVKLLKHGKIFKRSSVRAFYVFSTEIYLRIPNVQFRSVRSIALHCVVRFSSGFEPKNG